MIYECSLFYNELLLLEIKLNTLYNYVDRFIIVESTKTFSGLEKPLYLRDNKSRFERFWDKITPVVVSTFVPNNAVCNEIIQRNAALTELVQCKDDDIIIIADTDEIVNPKTITQYTPNLGICNLELQLYYYYLNLKSSNVWGERTKILPYSLINNDLNTTRLISTAPRIPNGGWHFSYLGGHEDIQAKLSACVSPDDENLNYEKTFNLKVNNKDHIKYCIENKTDLYGWGLNLECVPINESFPEFIINNENYFANYIVEGE